MKKYNHKKTGWIAIQSSITIDYVIDGKSGGLVPQSIIENSNDWEEIVEEKEAWKKEVVFRIHNLGTLYTEESAIHYIEKYMPQVTEEEISEQGYYGANEECLRNVLKSKGLYKE